MKRFALVFLVALLAASGVAAWWLKTEPGPPTVSFGDGRDVVGRQAAWDVVVRASGRPGLRWIAVALRAGGKTFPVLSEEFPRSGVSGSGVAERRLHLAVDIAAAGVPEGAARLEVAADTYAWHLFGGSRGAVATRDLTVDLTPPRVETLSTQHNMRLGAAELALFRVSEDAVEAGVAVQNYFFPAVRGYFADPGITVAFFAVPQDLTAAARPMVRAADAAGNRVEAALPCTIKDRKFSERSLEIDDAFLQRKVPEILSATGKPVPGDLVQGYLSVNRDLRRESEEKLRALASSSSPVPLWKGPFHRQSNAAPMSAFADRRSYLYKGETIDKQTHLGYDLASLKQAPVESAQDGVVVFAGYLGIYGNTVVVDHGLGVSSLYGHLSTIAVQPGQQVRAAETLGQTGETGLAGGDHLHFSVMVDGIHVDPVEWWDPLWMREHVVAKLKSFPTAVPASSEGEQPVAARAQTHGEAAR